MVRGSKQIICPWCREASSEAEVTVNTRKSDYGSLIERRCRQCHKVLAAYLENAGDFLPRIRRF